MFNVLIYFLLTGLDEKGRKKSEIIYFKTAIHKDLFDKYSTLFLIIQNKMYKIIITKYRLYFETNNIYLYFGMYLGG